MQTSTATIRPQKREAEVTPLVPVPTRFVIHSRDEMRIILFDEVVCCVADGNYTMIHLTDGSKCLVSKTLKEFERILFPTRFFRIHASYLVNLNCIKRIIKSQPYQVELPFNLVFDISRSRQKLLMQQIGAMCRSMPHNKKGFS